MVTAHMGNYWHATYGHIHVHVAACTLPVLCQLKHTPLYDTDQKEPAPEQITQILRQAWN